MAERNILLLSDDRIEFRIGINVGDVVVEDGDIFGDGVNVAARLENLAEPGGICVSARVQEDAAGKLYLAFEDMGEQTLKNIARPVRVYRLLLGTPASTPKGPPNDTGPVLALPDKPSIAVLPFANMSNDAEQEFFGDGSRKTSSPHCPATPRCSSSPAIRASRIKAKRREPALGPRNDRRNCQS